ncbi:sigma-54-dependent Fis family transcriptional regulator [Nonomuraea lactucae]|uniref:sigma-54-dependent Fis family transcriptional regulator n=1 Tax=Nonomuraea lactucae TaxID=2249762 RepID=UPI000DE30CEF|nr:helix-turn-helix domain-containing protein [Nonomuraea lactucae]
MPQRRPDAALAAARELYLEVAEDPRRVRPLVVASWQRSIEYEVRPGDFDAPYLDNPDLDTALARAALPILDRLHEQLARDPVSTMITDRDGVVLARKVSHDALTGRLNRVRLAPGHVYSERYVGTNGIGTALASGHPTMIIGSEHYVEALRDFQCAAVPILHPTRRTLMGAFNLTTTRQGSARMLMALARSIAGQIESQVAVICSRRERALFEDYMAACSSVRPGPVLALNREVVMMNEQLSAAVAGQDQHALLDHAREIAAERRFEGRRSIPLPSGRVAELRVSRCRHEDGDAGAVFRIKVIGRPQPRQPAPLRRARPSLGLVGSSPQWLRAVAEVEEAFGAGAWLRVVGEAGVGKTTLVEAVHRAHGAGRPLAVMEPPLSESEHVARQWLDDVLALLRRPSGVVVLRDIHLLGHHLSRRLEGLAAGLDRAASGRLVLTGHPSVVEADDRLGGLCDATVEVPPVRHRYEDIEQLVRFFLRRYLPHGESGVSPEALAVLQRCPWPENVRQLESVIRGLVRRQPGRLIRVEDLPPECRVSSHKVLTAIEALERDAILRGLVERDSNVQRTAQDLGISRATMYRKMRRYGIVPSSLT